MLLPNLVVYIIYCKTKNVQKFRISLLYFVFFLFIYIFIYSFVGTLEILMILMRGGEIRIKIKEFKKR